MWVLEIKSRTGQPFVVSYNSLKYEVDENLTIEKLSKVWESLNILYEEHYITVIIHGNGTGDMSSNPERVSLAQIC